MNATGDVTHSNTHTHPLLVLSWYSLYALDECDGRCHGTRYIIMVNMTCYMVYALDECDGRCHGTRLVVEKEIVELVSVVVLDPAPHLQHQAHRHRRPLRPEQLRPGGAVFLKDRVDVHGHRVVEVDLRKKEVKRKREQRDREEGEGTCIRTCRRTRLRHTTTRTVYSI